MKTIIVGVLIVVAVGAVVAVWLVRDGAQPSPSATTGAENVPAETSPAVVSEGGPAAEPNLPEGGPSPRRSERTPREGGPALDTLSLAAFAQRQPQGSNFTVGRVLAETEQYTRYYITYHSGELTISGIMNVPKGAGPFPVIIAAHGYIDPVIYTNGRGLKREQDYLARAGYIVLHPDYRNHAESSKDLTAEVTLRIGYVEDVMNGIAAIQASELPYVARDRVGILGHSMGGGVAQTLMVTHPDLIDAVVLFAPVSSDVRDNFNKWLTRRPEVAKKIVAMYGSPEDNPEFWDGISPVTMVDRVKVPVLIHHGTNDASVPLEWSEKLTQKLKAAGKDVTLHVYPGEPHEFAAAWPQVMQRTTAFFDTHLK